MNMKNTLKNILLGGLAVAMLASCDLNRFPSTAIPYEDGDFLLLSSDDVNDFNNGVLATYRGLHYGSHYQTVDVMTECFNASVDFGNNYGFVHRLGDGFNATDGNVEGIWAAHYGAIMTYNVAIEQVDMLFELYPETDLALQAYWLKANALFGRASSYLTLARAFSKDYDPATAAEELAVPLILKYNQNELPVRETLENVYTQILDDLDYAQELMEAIAEVAPAVNLNGVALYINGAPKSQAPTIDAVKAVKARCYLDMHMYPDAADCAMEVIESSAGYALAANADDMYIEFMLDDGKESLMRMYASKAEGIVGCPLYTSVGKTEDVTYFSPLFLPSQVIVDAYSMTDLRKQLWFPVSGEDGTYPVRIQGSYHNGIHVFTKYIGNPTLQSAKYEDGAHYCKPIMIAEMYLIAAEAYAADEDYTNAKAVLNTLKTARKAGSSASGDVWQEIKAEWLKETVGDGQRINCIKRWGDGLPERPAQPLAESLVMNTPVTDYTERTVDADSYTLVWPIPSYEMKIAPNTLIQNDGYSAQ
jgi:hypothetical protein